MVRLALRKRFVPLTVFVLLLAGCGGTDGGSSDSTLMATTSTTESTTTEATTTTTTSTTTTTLPETTTTSTTPTTTTSTLAPVPGGLDVTIESEIVPESDNWRGTFTATGPAVDDGVMCPSGELELQEYDQGIPTWRVSTKFVCADDSGKFWINYDLTAEITDEGHTESGTWIVTLGIDAYETLIGNGIDTTANPDTGVYISIMEGQLAITNS